LEHLANMLSLVFHPKRNGYYPEQIKVNDKWKCSYFYAPNLLVYAIK